MLEVGGRGRHGAHGRRVERPPHERQRQNPGDAACDLEAPRRDVLVRHPVAQEVKHRADEGRARP